MADSAAFESVCVELERATSLDRLEARGTIRIALKQAGLEAASVTPGQMRVVIARVLPEELSGRGVPDAESVCRQLEAGLAKIPDAPENPDTPEAVFGRLGG